MFVHTNQSRIYLKYTIDQFQINVESTLTCHIHKHWLLVKHNKTFPAYNDLIVNKIPFITLSIIEARNFFFYESVDDSSLYILKTDEKRTHATKG